MTDVTITNRRADSSANQDLTQLARHGADAFGYKASLRIDRKLAQLLRLRVSQINNCTYCLTSTTRPHAAPASPTGDRYPDRMVGDRLPPRRRPRRPRLHRSAHSRRRRDRRR